MLTPDAIILGTNGYSHFVVGKIISNSVGKNGKYLM